MTRGLAALTGGTGFLGRHLARALAADGWGLRLLARRDPFDVLAPDAPPPEVVLGDLSDAEALARLCHGADVVVHAAGLTKAPGLAAFRAVNTQGAGRVAAAARVHAPSAPFVLVSSLAAREPQLSDYARSKRDGEAAAAEALGAAPRVVRPCVIYGPGDREALALFRAARWSPRLPVLAPDARITLIHAGDAARAVAACAAAPASHGGAICDACADGYALREIMAAASAAVGGRARPLVAPDLLLRGAGRLGDLAHRLGAPSLLTSGKVRELLHRDWSLAAGERLVSAPPPHHDLASGFADTVAAYRAAGWLG